MMEERYHATTQNRFYPDMSNVNKILQWRQNLSAHLCILDEYFNWKLLTVLVPCKFVLELNFIKMYNLIY